MWNKLIIELDRWTQAGITATFWWRDDDAVSTTSALNRLLQASQDAGLLLAVIPKNANSLLANEISNHQHVSVAQHGYAHINYAPRGQKLGAWELGLHRAEQTVLSDLKQGHKILSDMFADKFISVVVPPWNRIDANLFPAMSKLRYKGVSAFGPSDKIELESGMIQVNCHCDPIKWKGGPRFTGMEKSIAMMCEHLAQKRERLVAFDEPTGLLTHHLDMDEQAWLFVAELANQIKQHPAALWCHPNTLFQINT